MKQKFIGKYRITEMEMWDQEYIDLVVPGYVEICKNGYAEFQFGVVEGGGHYSYNNSGDVSFRWNGSCECDEASGEFDIEIIGNKMTGTVYFDDSDQSDFVAIKEKS